MLKDLFDKPFDEGTKTKLDIFEKYLDNWLPTFIHGHYNKPIQIFDLFAGSGCDENGIPGSPLRTLTVIKKYSQMLVEKKKKVHIYLNDYDVDKYKILRAGVKHKVSELGLDDLVEIQCANMTFVDCFNEHKNKMMNGCNLIFLDQNGFKEVSESIFAFLMNLDTTDFMFFVASTYIHRFPDEPEVVRHHPIFDFTRIKNAKWKTVHAIICEEFRKYVPQHITSYAIVPFSIMKADRNNIYGLIFVTKHIRGADKFLQTVWKENALNGTANYDIDDDASKSQPDLFEGQKMTKIEGFQDDLKKRILSGEIKNNRDAFYHTINLGHISQHASEAIKAMKKEKIIVYNGKSPLVSYEKAVREDRIVEYKLV